MNIMAGLGVAVREFQLTTGEADYGLYIDGKVSSGLSFTGRFVFSRQCEREITSTSLLLS